MSEINLIRRNGIVGNMPLSMLTDKFNETNMGDYDPDDALYDYNRRVFCDESVETRSLFEHEAKRKTKSDDFLRLRHEGSRSGYQGYGADVLVGDDVYESGEFNTGLGSSEWRDREFAPSMRDMGREGAFRSRYKNLQEGGNYYETGGGSRGEKKILEDKREVDRQVKQRLKIFSRSIENTNPRGAKSRRDYTSLIDYVVNSLLVPATADKYGGSNNNVVAGGTDVRRDMNSLEGKLGVAKWGQLKKSSVSRSARVGKENMAVDSDFATSRNHAKAGKTMAQYMIQQLATVQDSEFAASKLFNFTGKTNDVKTDFTINRDTVGEISFEASREVNARSQAPNNPITQIARLVAPDGTNPDDYLQIGAAIYKSAIQKAGKMTNGETILESDSSDFVQTSKNGVTKLNIEGLLAARENVIHNITSDGKMVHSYKSSVKRTNGDGRQNSVGTQKHGSSDDGKHNKMRTREENLLAKRDTVNQAKFGQNDMATRHAAPMGDKSKANWRTARETAMGDTVKGE